MEEQGRVDVATWRLRSGVTVCRELTTEEGEGPDLVGARPCDWPDADPDFLAGRKPAGVTGFFQNKWYGHI